MLWVRIPPEQPFFSFSMGKEMFRFAVLPCFDLGLQFPCACACVHVCVCVCAYKHICMPGVGIPVPMCQLLCLLPEGVVLENIYIIL